MRCSRIPAASPRISFIHALDDARGVQHKRKRPLQNLTVQRDKEMPFVLAEALASRPRRGGGGESGEKKEKENMNSHARLFPQRWKLASGS